MAKKTTRKKASRPVERVKVTLPKALAVRLRRMAAKYNVPYLSNVIVAVLEGKISVD